MSARFFLQALGAAVLSLAFLSLPTEPAFAASKPGAKGAMTLERAHRECRRQYSGRHLRNTFSSRSTLLIDGCVKQKMGRS